MYLPFRMSRDYWKIPLYYIDLSRNDRSFIDVATIPLNHYHHAEDSVIYGDELNIFELDELVIPDTDFTVLFTCPFREPVEIPVSLTSPATLRTLLTTLNNIMWQLYEIERNTSTATEHTVTFPCTHCSEEHQRQFATLEDSKDDSGGDCSICFAPIESCISLQCGHIFHRACAEIWLNKGAPTCPLCRQHFVRCSRCNNTGMIEYTDSYVVIPRHLSQIRNDTNGVYGIRTLHHEDLAIDALWYNNVNHMLQVFVGCRDDIWRPLSPELL